MLRPLHMLVLTLATTLGLASSATAITAETALRADRQFSQHRVTNFAAQRRAAHQQSALGYGENASDSSLASRAGGKALPAPKPRGNPNTVPERGPIYVDSKGNAIPTPPGGRVTGSPDGRFVQARDAAGNPTGVRIDGPHRPATHPDPRAQQPHGHVTGVTNPDGTPWLPIR
jgi:hypothetical protein